MPVRDFVDEPFTDQCTPAQSRHVGFYPRFIDENQSASRHADAFEQPLRSAERDIGAVLFRRVDRLSLKDKRMALSVMQIVDCAQSTPSLSRSSFSVASGCS